MKAIMDAQADPARAMEEAFPSPLPERSNILGRIRTCFSLYLLLPTLSLLQHREECIDAGLEGLGFGWFGWFAGMRSHDRLLDQGRLGLEERNPAPGLTRLKLVTLARPFQAKLNPILFRDNMGKHPLSRIVYQWGQWVDASLRV